MEKQYCKFCGSELIFIYGVGWDYDRLICSKKYCTFEIELNSTTYPVDQIP